MNPIEGAWRKGMFRCELSQNKRQFMKAQAERSNSALWLESLDSVNQRSRLLSRVALHLLQWHLGVNPW